MDQIHSKTIFYRCFYHLQIYLKSRIEYFALEYYWNFEQKIKTNKVLIIWGNLHKMKTREKLSESNFESWKYKLFKINLQNNRQERLINKAEDANIKVSKTIDFYHLLIFHIYLRILPREIIKEIIQLQKTRLTSMDRTCDLLKSNTLHEFKKLCEI